MERAPTNKRKLGKLASTSLVIGNMIGSGIFLLPTALAIYGGISLFGWIFASIGAFVLAKVFANLSIHIPKSGGPYTYSREGFGDFIGFLVAWGYWISLCATNAAIIIAMLGYLSIFFPALGSTPAISVSVGLLVIWGLTWSNSRGIHIAGRIQSVTTIIKVIPLLSVALVGLFYINWSHFAPFNLSDKSNFQAIMECAALTFFAFLGLECATIPSEDVEGDQKAVSRATMMGTTFTIAVYLLSSFVVLGVVAPDQLITSKAPFADAGTIMWGENSKYWIAFGAVVSTFGALNGWLLSQAQMPLAAAKDKLFPKVFAETNDNGTPAFGFVISSVFISVIMILNFSKGLIEAFQFIILLSTLTALVPYLFSSISYVLVAHKKGDKWFWLLGLLAFCFSIWAIIGSGVEVISWGFILLMLGLPVYVFIKIKQ